mgnify:CR=1 FL=1
MFATAALRAEADPDPAEPSSPGRRGLPVALQESRGACSATIAGFMDEARPAHGITPLRRLTDRARRPRASRSRPHDASVLALRAAAPARVVQHGGTGRVARAQQTLHQVAACPRLRARRLVARAGAGTACCANGGRPPRCRWRNGPLVAGRCARPSLRDVVPSRGTRRRARKIHAVLRGSALQNAAHLLLVGAHARGHARRKRSVALRRASRQKPHAFWMRAPPPK